ncbi:DUF2306 domain-containing protein [Chloroflexales bacterium ZM16-3]|nr:DUF2306 domain-containing protein [Chloroflexales bacterium ZM16-3]
MHANTHETRRLDAGEERRRRRWQMIRRLLQTVGWGVMLLLALVVVAYAGFVLVTGAFPAPLRPALAVHHVALSAHIVGGIVALAIAPLQLVPRLRRRGAAAHRWLGRAAMLGMLVGGLGGLAMAAVAYGNLVSRLGFGTMALGWLTTAWLGYWAIRTKQVAAHRRWMLRNIALTLAAVTLRLWLPLLLKVGHLPFDTAYPLVAWLCWVPNLLIAEALVQRWPRPSGGRLAHSGPATT